MKKLAVLGSTGSIGTNALKVIRAYPEEFKIIALGAGKNIDLLITQIVEFRPKQVAVLDEGLASDLKYRLGKKNSISEVFFGTDGFKQLVALKEIDTVISAMTGPAGLLPTYAAIRAGKHVALANKETMVMAGSLIMAEAERQEVSVLPIDSEHSAILQSLQGHPREDLKRVILTASGGPFRNLTLEEMRDVTTAQALKHPNWKMGPKISIDSATMMNKAFEVIEAKWFFNLEMDQIGILIHPQSIAHSMVEYNDGSIIAQLGVPNMIIPISYALFFPHHVENNLPPLALERVMELTFEKPDMKRFRCLDLGLKAAQIGGSMPTVLNGANEIAVDSFLKGKIGFLGIPDLIEKTIETHNPYPIDNIETVIKTDKWARETAQTILQEDGS